MDSVFLVVGLGNPGKKYSMTRHNLGFLVVDDIVKRAKCSFKHRFKYWKAETKFGDNRIIIIKPKTYMNLSGVAVSKAQKKYNVVLSNILIICDDLNLPLGKIRIRGKGSAGGHNGLKSIIEHLGSSQFSRLRIGVSGDNLQSDVVEFVLSQFGEEEVEKIESVIKTSGQCVKNFIKDGLLSVMNEFN